MGSAGRRIRNSPPTSALGKEADSLHSELHVGLGWRALVESDPSCRGDLEREIRAAHERQIEVRRGARLAWAQATGSQHETRIAFRDGVGPGGPAWLLEQVNSRARRSGIIRMGLTTGSDALRRPSEHPGRTQLARDENKRRFPETPRSASPQTTAIDSLLSFRRHIQASRSAAPRRRQAASSKTSAWP